MSQKSQRRMDWRRLRWMAAICALTVAILHLLPEQTSAEFDYLFRDTILRRGERAKPSDELIFLALDSPSLKLDTVSEEEKDANPSLQAMAKGWPWPRHLHAELLDKLIASGAKLVVLDMMFPTPGRIPEADAALAAALERHRGKVVVAGDFQAYQGPAGEVLAYRGPAQEIMPGSPWLDGRNGYATFYPDLDGKIRGWTPSITLPDGERFPALMLAALQLVGKDHQLPQPGSDERLRLRFAEPGAWRPHSLYEVFVPALWERNFDAGRKFKEKIVLIGPTAPDFQDIHPTPFGQMTGPELHLNALSAALEGGFYRATGRRELPWLTALGALLAFLVTSLARKPLLALCLLVVAILSYILAAWILFEKANWLLTGFLPLAALTVGGVFCIGWQAALDRLGRVRTLRMLERMVSKDLARELVEENVPFEEMRRGIRRTPTTMFSDLRGFTTLTENAANPMALVTQLNEYLGAMSALVFEYQGQLDKFMGDAVMASWGSLKTAGDEEDARRAVRCALAMREKLRALNASWTRDQKPTFSIGIGLHHGPAIFAGVGNEDKTEFTVLGDTVNLASRLEGVTKRYATDIIISAAVAALLGNEFVLRPLDRVRVAGRHQAVDIFAVVGKTGSIPADRLQWLHDWSIAHAAYFRRDFAAAAAHFAALREADPSDSLCQKYLQRCEELLARPPGDDWEGIEEMGAK